MISNDMSSGRGQIGDSNSLMTGMD